MGSEHKEPTPGSWKVVSSRHGDLTIREQGSGRAICAIGWNYGTLAEREAHARLIATAPDLLAELEHALRMMESDDYAGYPQWRKDARAALAKARGGK